MRIVRIVSTVILLCVALACIVSATTYNTWLRRYEQEKTNWCWVACAQMLAKNQVATTVTQTEAVIHVKGSDVNEPAESIYEIEDAVKFISNNAFSTIKGEVVLQENALKEKMAAGYPVIAGMAVVFGTSGTGHAFVIDRYDDSNRNVRLVNPWPGSTTRHEYTYDQIACGVGFTIYPYNDQNNSATGLWIRYVTRYE